MTKPQDLQKPQPILEKSKLSESKTLLKTTIDINSKLTTQQSDKSLANTTELVKDSSNVGSKNISYQILAEPIRVVSPESIINAFIASVNTLGQAVIKPVKDALEKAAELSQNPKAIDNNQIKDCVDKATKKCTAVADTQANSAELTNGHIITAGFNKQIIVGNSVDINSDTSTSISSPYTGITSQDVTVTGNNSITQVTDFLLGKFKQLVNTVEGTLFTQSQTSLKISTETNDDISKVNRSVGTEEISSLGKVNKLIADTTLLAASGGTTQIASYDSIGMQSNGDVSITAAKSDSTANVEASADLTNSEVNKGGSIYLLSTPESDTTNVFVMGKGGILNSTTGDLFNSSAGNSITRGSKSAVMTSDNFSYVGTPQGGMFVKGGRTFLGKLSFPVINIAEASVVNIPALPVLPSLPTQQLENCIPKGLRTQFPDANTTEAILTTESDDIFNPESFSNPTEIQIKPPAIPTANNKVQLPRGSQTFPDYDPNGEKIFSNKLPAPSVTAPKENNLAIVSPFTTLNVLVDRYTKESKESILDLTTASEVMTFNSLVDLLDDQSTIEQFAEALASPEDIMTSSFIKSYVENTVPSSVLEVLDYAQFYIDLLQVPLNKIESFTLTIEDFLTADKSQVQTILNLIAEYPSLKAEIIKLIKDATAIPAIGFLSVISNLTSSVSSIANFANIPKIIQSGDFNSIVSLVTPYLSSALIGTPFGALLSNPDLLNIGQGLLSGNLDIENLLKGKLESIVTGKVGDLLGSQSSTILPILLDTFYKVKVGESINPQDYIAQLTGLLQGTGIGDSVNLATSIYSSVESILNNVGKGDILSIVTGSDVNSLLTTVLGSTNAGSIGKVFELVKEGVGTYEAVKLLPELLSLMNDYNIPALDQVGIALNCLDLFNKVSNLLNSLPNFSNGGSNKSTTAFIEDAGRLVQAVNTINSVDNNTLDSWNSSVGGLLEEPINLQDIKQNININLSLDACFKLPKLNTFQAEIEVIDLQPSAIQFKLTNVELLQSNFYLLPKTNDLIQLKVRGFYSVNSREYLSLYQTDFQYTPSVYNFVITSYDLSTNTGIAYYDRAYSSVVLENNEGILYKFNTESIGSTLSPDIISSYLLA